MTLPFVDRPLALPVLARLWCKGGVAKTVLARELVGIIAAARPDRRIHVVADSAYICTRLRHLPATVTLTGPLPRNAALWKIRPNIDAAPSRRGRPSTRGEKIGTPDRLAAITPAISSTVTRCGRTRTVTLHERRCLWYGVFRSHPVRVILVAEPGKTALALVTIDPDTRPHRSWNATPAVGASRSPSPTPKTSLARPCDQLDS